MPPYIQAYQPKASLDDASTRELFGAVWVRLKRVVPGIFAYSLLVGAFLYLWFGGGRIWGLELPENPNDQDTLAQFIEWFSVFYTLVLTFIIGQGWRRFQKINSEIDRESDALILLLRTSEMCQGANHNLREELVRTVVLYVEKLKLKRERDERIDSVTHELMKQIHVCIRNLIQNEKKKHKNARIPDCVKGQLLQYYAEAYDARGDRFDTINQQLPRLVWPCLIFVSVIWLWGFVWLKVESSQLKSYMSIGIIGVVSFLYFVAKNLISLDAFKPNFLP
ncbi:DUF4239 domain-containing protein, partial [candidate division KSB1 bacterium]|nr:DUF4239 domain-containing protein [candidate division KSB1 bacterium]